MDIYTDHILMIAAGMKQKKKEFMNKDFESMYLNYGLLGLATILYEKGYNSVHMFQGDYKIIDDLIVEIKDKNIDIKKLKYPLFISIPSFLAVSWTLEFIKKIKALNPNVKIIVGGRWVVDKNIEWLFKKLPDVDLFCQGCPDEVIDKLLNLNNWMHYKNESISSNYFKRLNYTLLNNFNQYQPVIEICRGCGMNCGFCLEKNYPPSKVKSPMEVILEAKEICKLYNNNNLNFYFEASMFNPTIKWSRDFAKVYTEFNMSFKWRFETRVDTLNVECIEILSKVGLKVIDLGLESASLIQLERMGKSKKPEDYLIKASQLIKKMFDFGVWAKLNILLYIGETFETINETMNWLDEHKQYFKGVSVNPFLLYLNGCQTFEFISKIIEVTGIAPNIQELYENGFVFVDLSPDISIEKAKEISIIISEKYMNRQDFIELKRICYTKLCECVED
jgi:radical SAM superfamily enzyme YgiQ (UPF0313 family)